MRAPIELRPSSNPVAGRVMLIGKPTPVAKVAMDPTSNAVMTVTKILFEDTDWSSVGSKFKALRLVYLALQPLHAKKASSSPIFFNLYD